MGTETEALEWLSLQLSEIEMLTSMYPNPGELVMDDPLAVSELQMCVDGETEHSNLKSRIGFTLNLDVGEQKKLLEVVCNFPHEYPSVLPQIYLRASWLSKSDHRSFSDALQGYIQTFDSGEILMCYVIEWLVENAEGYIKDEPEAVAIESPSKGETHFTRMWIYSHHIYSKWKRSDILSFSKELELTGFSMPGKPGIIAIEGYRSNVEEFWSRIRRMQWKHLVMKEREDTELGEKDVDDFRVFTEFGEKSFEPRQSKGRGAHADRGLLFQFMKEHGCAHIFPMYFGVEGKCADGDSD